jgi:MYXO-CTERM domain-containing protein
MNRQVLTALAALLTVACLTPVASAKGPSEASIEGPGLSGAVSLSGYEGSGTLGDFLQRGGFFPAVFARAHDPMQDTRPKGELGPKYVVTYVMPGPNNEEDVLLQDVYPYGQPEAVTYMEPGQLFWTTRETRGGWFVGGLGLTNTLVDAGLPASPPATVGDEPSFPWTVVGPVAAGAMLLGLGALGVFLVRRRPHPAV